MLTCRHLRPGHEPPAKSNAHLLWSLSWQKLTSLARTMDEGVLPFCAILMQAGGEKSDIGSLIKVCSYFSSTRCLFLEQNIMRLRDKCLRHQNLELTKNKSLWQHFCKEICCPLQALWWEYALELHQSLRLDFCGHTPRSTQTYQGRLAHVLC